MHARSRDAQRSIQRVNRSCSPDPAHTHPKPKAGITHTGWATSANTSTHEQKMMTSRINHRIMVGQGRS